MAFDSREQINTKNVLPQHQVKLLSAYVPDL